MQGRDSVKGPDAPGPIRQPRVGDDDPPPATDEQEAASPAGRDSEEEDRAVL